MNPDVNQAFKDLAAKYLRIDGFAEVPEAEIRRFAREHGMTEEDALGRYGWWAEGGHQWPQYCSPEEQKRFEFKVGDRVVVKERE